MKRILLLFSRIIGWPAQKLLLQTPTGAGTLQPAPPQPDKQAPVDR